MTRLKFIDLFCGAGGFHLGLTEIADCVMACDINKKVRTLYETNFHHTRVLGDINLINTKAIPPYDILCAGFPCQPFSIAGKRRGLSSSEGILFFQIVKIARDTRPEFLLLENVEGIKTAQNGKAFKIILESLQDIGYSVAYVIMNPMKFGLPQHRKRIFILGSRSKTFSSLTGEAIGLDYTEESITSHFKYYTEWNEQQPAKYYIKPNQCCYHPLIAVARDRDRLYKYRPDGTVRTSPVGVCPTLTANMGTGGHHVPFLIDNFGIRKLTPRECFNLQGFPRTYNLAGLGDSTLYSIAGNSVPPVMVLKAWDLLTKSLIKPFNKGSYGQA